ncbi:Phosphatidylglycerophosphatase B [Candidatus Erwinia haradaeae]|uniref:undecaprenyl-diphosphate phosphatase n=1 Tax=Candidatus Erwinia haradaeae TaxID=1922217 RepID=A0A451CZP6_9GAMM|nr:phosphatidylglycerophosphatase B [Candidatus Erwinia haradaeae]VFP78775.1 Phosphatidylglycerophosphatase B [Candidatus Erwinia haradaeae]
MLDIFKRITIGSLILLLMPVLVILSGWKWQPMDIGWGHVLMYGITATINDTWVIWTSIILCSWFVYCLRFSFKSTILLIIILISSLMIGEGIKTFLKNHVKELRPYKLWISENYQTNVSNVMQEKDLALQDKAFICSLDTKKFPQFLIQHWSHSNNFSFPSGHTLFACTWALIGIGVLWPRRYYCTVVIIMIWALAVMASRLIFGMHWSIDLIVAIIFSWILAILVTILLERLNFIKTKSVRRKC